MSFFSIKKNGEEVAISSTPEPAKDIPLTPSGHVDVEEIVRQHHIIERAHEDAGNHEPSSELTQRVTSERELDDLMNRYVNRMRDKCSTAVRNIDTAINEHFSSSKHALDEVEEALLVSNTGALLEKSDYTDYVTCKNTYDKAKKSFEDFQTINRRTQPAEETSDKALNNALIWLTVGIVLESVVNCGFFSANLSGGYLEGIAVAFMASAFNIGIASFIALGSRYILCPIRTRPFSFLFGLVCAIFNIALLLAISFSVAHYREALAIDDENPGRIAMNTIMTNPLGIQEIESIALLVLSIVLGCIAIYKITHYKDPYPGYHEKTHAFYIAHLKWQKENQNFIEHLEHKRDQRILAFNEKLKKVDIDIASIESSINSKSAELTKYNRVAENAATALRSLIGTYRQANRAKRATTAPKYFDSYDDVDYPKLDPIAYKDSEEQAKELSDLKLRYEDIRSKAKARKAEIHSQFEEEKDSLFNSKELQ